MNSYYIIMILCYLFGGACMAYLLAVGIVILKIQVDEFIKGMKRG